MADEFTKAALYGIRAFNKKVKEKIGIERLIALLNEFETPQSGVVFKSYDDYDGTFYGVDIDGETEIAWSDSFICGKRFQWVKWLVENDKIDFSKVKEKIGLDRELYDRMLYWYKEDDFLIMILSVENEPIRFLCEIIK